MTLENILSAFSLSGLLPLVVEVGGLDKARVSSTVNASQYFELFLNKNAQGLFYKIRVPTILRRFL